MTRKDNEVQKKIRNRIVHGNHEGFSSKNNEARLANNIVNGFKLITFIFVAVIVIWITVTNK